MTTNLRQTIVMLVLVTSTIGCDRVTKHLAALGLAGGPRRSYLADTLRLDYAENPGAFLSLGRGLPRWARTALFTVGSALALAVMSLVALRHRWQGRALVGLALVWAGGISNLIDRIVLGRVIDFLNVGVGSLRTGIFNVADAAILAGIVLIVSMRRVPEIAAPPVS